MYRITYKEAKECADGSTEVIKLKHKTENYNQAVEFVNTIESNESIYDFYIQSYPVEENDAVGKA